MSLEDLIERVEGATGPDREIEARLWCLQEGREFRKVIWSDYKYPDGQKHWHSFRTNGGDVGCHSVPKFTASLDAALALCERVLPGVWWLIGRGKLTAAEPEYGAQLMFGEDEVLGVGEAPTPAVALILALLRALLSKDTTR